MPTVRALGAGGAGWRWTRRELTLLALCSPVRRPRSRAVSIGWRSAGSPGRGLDAAAMAAPVARRLAAARLRPSAVADVLQAGAADRRARGLAPRASARRAGGSSGTSRTGARSAAALRRDLLALGVPRRAAVGAALGIGCDGAGWTARAGSVAEERELVKEWLTSGKEA